MPKEVDERVTRAAVSPPAEIRSKRATVEIGWTEVGYELYALDGRTVEDRGHDEDQAAPNGSIVVIIPGHGQTAGYPKRMAAAAASLSRSKIVWSIDITPPAGGDPIKAKALVRIVQEEIEKLFPGAEQSATVTLMGWSHGGAEAMRAAEEAPDLFPQVVGLCPAGMVERGLLDLLRGFVLEVARILWSGLRELDWVYIKDVMAAGMDLLTGLTRDLVRGRSVKRLVDDIRWASRKVPGEEYGYPGEVLIVFGGQDTVIRWQDVFPACGRPEEIDAVLDDYRQRNFPRSRQVRVKVIDGNHFAPETDALAFVRPALALLGQLDRPGFESESVGGQ